MKTCQKCASERLLDVTAQAGDCCALGFKGDLVSSGYLQPGLGIGSGDTVEFLLCLTCGQLQGTFPVMDPVNMMAPNVSRQEVQ